MFIRWVITIQRNFCLDHTEHEWRTWLSHHNGSPRSLVKGFILFTSLCDCSVKTELVCRDNYAKKSQPFPNRLHCVSTVFLELTSRQWGRCTENWTSDFGKFQQHPFCNFVPDSSWTVFTDRVPLLFRTRTNEWPLSFSKSSRVQRYELGVCQTFCFVVFCSTRNVVEHRHK